MVAPTRTLAGVELPAAGVWEIDPGHADVAFIGRHFLLTKVRGRFTGVSGAVTVAEDPQASSVEVVIDMATVHSGDQARDDHLRSGDFFEVEKYPTARFASTSVTWNGTSGTIVGDLTIRDVTRPVTLDTTFVGYARDPWENDRAVFSATAKINREDWDLTWNMALEAGGLLVSKDIQLEIEVETILKAS